METNTNSFYSGRPYYSDSAVYGMGPVISPAISTHPYTCSIDLSMTKKNIIGVIGFTATLKMQLLTRHLLQGLEHPSSSILNLYEAFLPLLTQNESMELAVRSKSIMLS